LDPITNTWFRRLICGLALIHTKFFPYSFHRVIVPKRITIR
jgi:hypothetical protein